ncbi:TRAP transporter substrate-binding protein DctP [Mesorhizobium sp. L-8-3]|uniref:TRAP transporter substrate-binding protein DctP n=1 Tax=Mesorhizobium sp. L-8-3 TaxID=2744522 RepID=UPI0019279C2C|nr:TRAP transporter substrate-binding protein DctP [Mesorhizobium sp. L-8-3]BCH20789.1 C4-dicarboxylate ABC transporter [Mesorhizobium sp. L-8-3]
MRRTMNRLATGIAAIALTVAASAAFAQDKIELIYSDTVPETDIRTATLREAFGACLGDGFDFKSYHGATLFKQGTELTAMQRGNLDMASLAVFDFYNQVPHTTILGTAYLFRSYDHMRAVMDGDAIAKLYAEIEEKAKVKILANPYIGTRHVNIRGNKKTMVPADLAGVKLRMPGGEGWQFVGEALGANPTPLAFTEVYTALQTGAIDGQDNPLPADKAMKFYEVTDQIVLTGHLIANNQFAIALSKWESMNADQQAKVQECATNFQNALDKVTLDQEAELVDFFKAEGLDVYEPDKEAFRNHVLEVYKASKYSAEWPEGLLDKINAL